MYVFYKNLFRNHTIVKSRIPFSTYSGSTNTTRRVLWVNSLKAIDNFRHNGTNGDEITFTVCSRVPGDLNILRLWRKKILLLLLLCAYRTWIILSLLRYSDYDYFTQKSQICLFVFWFVEWHWWDLIKMKYLNPKRRRRHCIIVNIKKNTYTCICCQMSGFWTRAVQKIISETIKICSTLTVENKVTRSCWSKIIIRTFVPQKYTRVPRNDALVIILARLLFTIYLLRLNTTVLDTHWNKITKNNLPYI